MNLPSTTRLRAALRACAAAALVLALGSLSTSARGDTLDDAVFRKSRDEAARRMSRSGDAPEKRRLAASLAAEDSERTAKVIVQWAVASAKLTDGDLTARVERARRERVDVVKGILKRVSSRTIPPDAERDFPDLAKARRAEDDALRALADERTVLQAVEDALAKFRDAKAIAYLAGPGGNELDRIPRPAGMLVRRAVAPAVLRAATGADGDALRAWLERREDPEVRVAILHAVAKEKIGWAGPLATRWVTDKSEFVQRAAVRVLELLDVPGCIDVLIVALHTESGLLADQVERALYTYTGQRFGGDPLLWSAWWADHKDAWSASPPASRWKPEDWKGAERGASVYGLRVRSTRVVFVFDRSESMTESLNAPPVDPLTSEFGEEAPPFGGKTDFEVARSYLLRTVESLPPAALIAALFYGADVQTWKEPPDLCRLDEKNRRDALAWIAAIEPEGCTLLFDALDKALEYAVPAAPNDRYAKPRADTIYLLSDGSPTDEDGVIIRDPLRETRLKAFLERAKAYDCVVHTIGVGPAHARDLMRRIARETGGMYVPVGQ